jgi:ribonuclease HI
MELIAAIKALEALKVPCNVELHTDSNYLQKAFNDGWIDNWQKNDWRTSNDKPVANQDLWQRLLGLVKIHDIQWFWVKGHANNKYNERCDELVWQAREEMKQTKS